MCFLLVDLTLLIPVLQQLSIENFCSILLNNITAQFKLVFV
jgi:hypothetical protein